MNDNEQKILQALASIIDCIGSRVPEVSTQVKSLLVKAELLYHSDSDLTEKNDFARLIESAYIGMGGLFNYYPIHDECWPAIKELLPIIKDLLKIYWRELGNEWNNAGQFKRIPIGTKVDLIKGELREYTRYGERVYVEEEDKDWEVVTNNWTDVSNMPLYQIRRGPFFGAARHNALRVVR